MSLQEQIRNIIFYYVKKQYNGYLLENQIKYIPTNEIIDVVKKLYIDKRDDLKIFIRSCLKEMLNGNYQSLLVENIMLDIFDDDNFAIHRCALEIEEYQNYILNKDSSKNEYNISLIPDKEFGVGMQIDFDNKEIVVKNYKRHPITNSLLPAEKSGSISIGDNIIEINNTCLEKLSTEQSIKVIKKCLSESKVHLKLRSHKIL